MKKGHRITVHVPAPDPRMVRQDRSALVAAVLATFFVGIAASPELRAASAQWELVWEDRFEREELGSGWFLRRGRAEIVGGRLFLTGAGATILVDRGFGPDVKLEFVAEANPELPPCDLSAALGSNNFWGYEYLLAFGGNNNQLNQILGGTARKVDRSPPLLIERGKKYKLVALKEGRRLAYFVNGTKILESEDDDPVGGPGFDRVGLVTWNGMYVDYVKVYERSEPAPGGPVVLRSFPDLGFRWESRKLSFRGELSRSLEAGIRAYNDGDLVGALDHFSAQSPPTAASAAGLAYVLGDLAFDESPKDQEHLVQIAAEVSRKSRDPAASVYALAARWFHRINLRSRDRRATTRLVVPGPQNNPFYYKAQLYRARYHYASALEGADTRRRREALDIFASLKELWPDHPSLRELTGERVPWREDLIHAPDAGPAWARHLQECFARQQAILEWWCTKRQSPDGQLGGGWGDDVEILRSWVPVACISSAGDIAVQGIERLAEGVWRHVLKEGYVPGVGDVEHNAEPPGDALPGMILLRYGDPRFVEYNLRSAKTIREKFLAVNERGRLQFRSAEFGTNGVSGHPRAGGDTGYHARAMRHFIWLAWYGVPEARDVFLDWCETWRQTTMERIGTKPSGFVPASIFFPSGGIDPPDGRPWHDPGAHYYGFPGITSKIHESFLTAYWLSGDRRFLDPVETMLDLSTTGPLVSTDPRLPRDHPHNLIAHLLHQAQRDVLAVDRWLTGERVYDGYAGVRGSPLTRFAIDGDLEAFAEAFERLAENLRYGWACRTREVLQTDRAGLGGATLVFGAYTGAVRDFRDSATPTLAVTWVTPDINFAAVVTEATAVRLRVRIYRFGDSRARIGLRPWRLRAGRYSLRIGEPLSGERGLERHRWRSPVELDHRHRGSPIWIAVEPGKTWVVDLRLRQPIERPAFLPDLAVAPRDVRIETGKVAVRIHNIGGAPAGAFSVTLQVFKREEWTEVTRVDVSGLPAIRDFEPVVRDLELDVPVLDHEIPSRVVIDPDDSVDEICEGNNVAPAVR